MAKTEIRLSIIVPFYGVEKYIGQCLSSLLEQDIPEEEYEVICVNDCSPDASERIVLDFQNKHGNVVLLRHEENKKLGAARNTGLAAAKGKYIWFVDSDDYIKNNCLKELLGCCDSYGLDLLHWSVQDNGGRQLVTVTDSPVTTGVEDLLEGSQDVTFPWNRIYRREFLIQNDLWFNDLWGGDVIHSIQALNLANRMMNKSECYYYYRTDNMNSDMRSPVTANKVISFSYVLARALDDCKSQLSTALFPVIDEFVEWRVNQSYKPVLRMPFDEKRVFYHSMREDESLRSFVLGVANRKVRFVLCCPLAVFLLHPFYSFIKNVYSLVRHQ